MTHNCFTEIWHMQLKLEAHHYHREKPPLEWNKWEGGIEKGEGSEGGFPAAGAAGPETPDVPHCTACAGSCEAGLSALAYRRAWSTIDQGNQGPAGEISSERCLTHCKCVRSFGERSRFLWGSVTLTVLWQSQGPTYAPYLKAMLLKGLV